MLWKSPKELTTYKVEYIQDHANTVLFKLYEYQSSIGVSVCMCPCFSYLFLFIREVKSRFACHADKMFSALGLLCISRIINNGFVRTNKVKEASRCGLCCRCDVGLKGTLILSNVTISLCLIHTISRLISKTLHVLDLLISPFFYDKMCKIKRHPSFRKVKLVFWIVIPFFFSFCPN